MNTVRPLFDAFKLHSFGKWIVLASLVGVVAGLGAIAFDVIGKGVVRFSLAEFAGYTPPDAVGEHSRFENPSDSFSPWMIVVVMTVGGLISGVIVYTLAPEAEGSGTDTAIDAFHNKQGGIRGRIPFVKTIASAITLGTGGSGGREGPIAQIGAGFGSWLGTKLKLSHRERRIMLAAGMGAGIGAIFRAPLPTMLVSTLTFVACHRWRIHQKQVPSRMDSRAHRGDFIIDVLEGLQVNDIFRRDRKIMMIPEGMTLERIVHRLAYNHQHYFPVVDADQRMVGIFSDDDVRCDLYDDTIWDLAVARDVMTSNFISVTPQDNLNTALKRFTSLNLDELPVIDQEDSGRLLGMLRRKETIAAYNQRLIGLKQAADEEETLSG